MEECVLLFKSTKYFAYNSGGKNKTYLDNENFKSNLKNYVKINQKNFWAKWFEIELKEIKNIKKKECELEDFEDESILKQETLLNVCKYMIELEIPKTTVKNYCDYLNDKYFGKNSEIGEKLSKEYIKKITSAKYASNTI